MDNINEILDKCKSKGIHECAIIPTSKVVFLDEVRNLCKANQCGMYGKTWACPPAVGDIFTCKEQCLKYSNVLVFTTKSDLEDSFDFEGMMEGKKIHEKICKEVRDIFKKYFPEILVLTSEGCSNCDKCTYPDSPCRFPEDMHPSVESYGIMVSEEAKSAKVHYINGVNTVTYFSNIFFNL